MDKRPPIKHKVIDVEIIWKKIYNQLDENEDVLFERWISEDPANEAYFKGVLADHTEDSTYQRYHRKEAAWNSILDSAAQLPTPSRKTVRWQYISAAASVALILAVALFFYSIPAEVSVTEQADAGVITPGTDKAVLILSSGDTYELEGDQKGEDISENQVTIQVQGDNIVYDGKCSKLLTNMLIIPKGGKYSLTLSDGTQVFLNSQSTLKYPVNFVGDERSVELSGEAYFDVVPSDKPFIVNTSSQRIEVLGTSFNVLDYDDMDASSTTLVEGKVVVIHKETSARFSLIPDQHLRLSKNSGQSILVDGDIFQHVAWKDGLFVFEEASLEWIMEKLERWYDINVFFKKEQRKLVIFSGEIDRYEDFENVLQLLEMTNEVEFEIKERTVIVR